MTSRRGRGAIPVIDLFAGSGGLGEGFSATPSAGGEPAFKIKLSIEMNAVARSTLALRSFFRQFPEGEAPPEYYSLLAGELRTVAAGRRRPKGVSWEDAIGVTRLYEAYPKQAACANQEAVCLELREKSRAEVDQRISAARGRGPWVLVGGPPCQAYSLIGRNRRNGIDGYRPHKDPRYFLYLEYLNVIAQQQPPVFVMENVPGLISSTVRQEKIFDRMIEDLQAPHRALGMAATKPELRYEIMALAPPSRRTGTPHHFVVKAEDYSIPQARHRVILVGVKSDVTGRLGSLTPSKQVTAGQVLGGLPRLRSGLSKGDTKERWQQVVASAATQRWFGSAEAGAIERPLRQALKSLRDSEYDRGQDFTHGPFRPAALASWYCDERLKGICNHYSRGHMKEDLFRYLFVATFAKVHGYAPSLRAFPKDLVPEHLNLQGPPEEWEYVDRFKVQVENESASTVTSHIAKDGHYYIHYDPSQVRSLTVLEAARLQTFPDNYFFMGSRTDAYHQVGNAVPPLLAGKIAERILALLD